MIGAILAIFDQDHGKYVLILGAENQQVRKSRRGDWSILNPKI